MWGAVLPGGLACAVAVLVLPLLVYWGLPRVYLLVWYRLRRDWVLVEGDAGGRRG